MNIALLIIREKMETVFFIPKMNEVTVSVATEKYYLIILSRS